MELALDIDTLLLAVAVLAIIVPAAVWGLRRYQQLMADGKITLNEALDAIEDAADVAEAAKDEIEDAIDKHKAKKGESDDKSE